MALPYTLRAVDIIALCQERLQDIAENGLSDTDDTYDTANYYIERMERKEFGTEKSRSRGSTNIGGPPRPRNRALPCPRYKPNFVRNERIYFSMCDNCVRTRGAQANDFNEMDLQICLEYNHGLLESIMNGVREKEYFQLVRDWYYGDGIRRYICIGARWYIIEPPNPNSLTLRPDPDPEHPEYEALCLVPSSVNDIPEQVLDDVGSAYWNYNPFADMIHGWLDGVYSPGQVIPQQQAVPFQGGFQGQGFLPNQAFFPNQTIFPGQAVIPGQPAFPGQAIYPGNPFIPDTGVLPKGTGFSDNIGCPDYAFLSDDTFLPSNVQVSDNALYSDNVLLSENTVFPENTIFPDNTTFSNNVVTPGQGFPPLEDLLVDDILAGIEFLPKESSL
ncbi:hypothetical protein GGR53DRAFT_463354 [Hypoxylon sp. FL1150]|nr:hypothetical protein GGR53DRAFT_463354 [Hypoxylon sp. FL1150]